MTIEYIPRLAAAAAVAALGACAVGPDYVKPAAPVAPQFKEAEGWKPAEPKVAASGESWWSVYNDPVLDGLERQVDVSNQTLKASEAAFRAAEAIVSEADAGYFPTIGLGGSAIRSGGGPGTSTSSGRSGSSSSGRGGGFAQNTFAANASTSWIPDIWGAVRRTVESDVAAAQASAADVDAARLAAQSALAADYFELRMTDDIKRLLDDTVDAYRRDLQIAQNRYNVGTAARTDVASAQAQLENTRAQSIATGIQRAQFEHAIAVLTGKPPGDFGIEPMATNYGVPVAPAGVPSALLERNPTIAAAERSMQAANALIGLQISGYFPTVTLGASYGQQSSMLGQLFNAANSLWSFGLSSVSLPIFNGGLTAAKVAQARATYDEAVANYRQTVLTTFEAVEDQLSDLRILAQQADVQAGAVQAARLAEQLTLNQYRAGTTDYTAVITAQATSLTSQQAALSILQSRLVASVNLIVDLGGGWDMEGLPSPDQVKVLPDEPQPDSTVAAPAATAPAAPPPAAPATP
jgi:NodT family efflux transporter outer membrane factor (OMF) lipoprotein